MEDCVKNNNFDLNMIINLQNIHEIVANCPYNIFKKFVKNCPNLDILSNTNYALIHYCCVYGSDEQIILLTKYVNVNIPCPYIKHNNSIVQLLPQRLKFYEIYPLHIVCLYRSYDVIFHVLNKSNKFALKENCISNYWYMCRGSICSGTTLMSIYDILFYKKSITNDQYQNLIYNIQLRTGPIEQTLSNKIKCFLDISRIRFEMIFDYVYYFDKQGKKIRRKRYSY